MNVIIFTTRSSARTFFRAHLKLFAYPKAPDSIGPGLAAKIGNKPGFGWTLQHAAMMHHTPDRVWAFPVDPGFLATLADPVARARCTPAELSMLDNATATAAEDPRWDADGEGERPGVAELDPRTHPLLLD